MTRSTGLARTRGRASLLPPTLGQEQALALFERVVREQLPYAVVAGFAGTGKTSLLKLIRHQRPLLLAPTGKAALRLREATGRQAYTIHRALYEAREDEGGLLSFRLKGLGAVLPQGCQVVVVDEASMVSEQLFDDLVAEGRRLELPVVFIGDPAQLPPVEREGQEAWSVLRLSTGYRVELSEVLRQVEGSPIIAASMKLRPRPMGQVLTAAAWREAVAELPKVDPARVVEEALAVHRRGGVVICHSNRTRADLNAALRKAQGYPDQQVQPGEPLLIMRNDYVLDVYNGETATFAGWERAPKARRWAGAPGGVIHIGEAWLEIPQGAGQPPRRELVRLCQEGIDGRLGWRDLRQLARGYATEARFEGEPLALLEAEYGYALTAHKSQGSEWREVMVVVEPSVSFSDQAGWRWTYTAVTRAKERVQLHLGLRGIPRLVRAVPGPAGSPGLPGPAGQPGRGTP